MNNANDFQRCNIATGSTNKRPSEAIFGNGYELLVDAKTTNGAYELMKFVVPPALGPPTHMHTLEDEHYFFLEGTFEVTIGDVKIEATKGTFLHLPRNVPHGLINKGDTEGSFLCWVIPGNLGEFFAQFTKPWPAEQKHPPVVDRDDVRKMVALSESFGIKSSL